MTAIRKSSEACRKFIIENVDKNPATIAKLVTEKFHISRQAANKHLQKLVEEKVLAVAGNTKARVYSLVLQTTVHMSLSLLEKSWNEDSVWRNEIAPKLGVMPENLVNIWHYCFTEMLNNAIDHSDGKNVSIEVTKTAAYTEVMIHDDGVGIFRKIQAQLNLQDERHSVLELAKGKFTTDPANHSGEGIIFSSRVCDDFQIL